MVQRAGPDLRCARSSGSWRTPGRRRSPRPPRSCPPTPRSRCCTSRPATSRTLAEGVAPRAARRAGTRRRPRRPSRCAPSPTRPPQALLAEARERLGREAGARAPPRARRARGRGGRRGHGHARARARRRPLAAGSAQPRARPRASSSTTRRAACCWCGPTRRRGRLDPAAADRAPPPPTTRRCRTSTRCAPRCAPTTSARCAHVRRRRRVRHALRALLHRAARPAGRALRRRPALRRRSGARCSTRSPRTAAERARASCARSTTSARSRPTGCSASRRSATSPTSTASPGRCAGVRERLPYLRELGVSYLHLMPLLRARPAPNDGGYAVVDYGAVEPALGTMDDLRALAADLRAAGMALCIDVVLNHTAREHPWAQAALAGDARTLAFYRTFADRTEPDAYERTLPEVFPDIAPGQLHLGAGARAAGCGRRSTPTSGTSTTRTPRCSRAMAEAMLELAAAGVDVLRLDAVPFLWKRMGTELPEPARGPRAAAGVPRGDADRRARRSPSRPRRSSRRATSSRYLGAGRHEGKECDLAYHNVLMVLLWSALASGRVALLTQHAARDAAGAARRRLGDLRALPRRHRLGDHRGGRRRGRRGRATCTGASWPTSTPATSPARSRAARASSPTRAPARRARAAPRRRWPASRRRSRAATSSRVELALRRILLLYAVAFAHGGAAADLHGRRARPAQRPRVGGRSGPRATTTAGCTGRRWTGRRPSAAHDPALGRGPPVGRAAPAGRPRAARTRAVHAQGAAEPLWTGNDHVFGLLREQAGERAAAAGQLHARAPAGRPGRRRTSAGSTLDREAARARRAPAGAEAATSSSSSPTSTSGCATNAIQHSRGLRFRGSCRCRG